MNTEITVEATWWRKGEPPLEEIVLIWNGKQMFGPISFYSKESMDLFYERMSVFNGGRPTHYLIVPKCE